MPTTAYSHRIFQLFVLSLFLTFPTSSTFAGKIPVRQPFGIDDYFKIQRVTELSLSSDGEMVAYAVESPSLKENKTIRTVYISATATGAEPILIDKIQNAKSFAWIPGTHELAYLLSDGDPAHVYSFNTTNNNIRQHTNGGNSVLKFRFAPDGDALAWLTRDDPSDESSLDFPGYKRSGLHERMFNGEEGVVIDSENLSFFNFVNPEWPDVAARPSNNLRLKQTGIDAVSVKTPGQVKRFHWSSDSSKLSILYTADDIPKDALSDRLTSLGIFDVTTKTFQTLARARPPSKTEKARYFTGGEWVPGEDKLFVRRTIEQDRWKKMSAWTSVDISNAERLNKKTADWSEFEIYRRDSEPAIVAISESTFYSNKTVHARRSLYQITSSGLEKADILQNVEGSVSHVRFSADFEKAVFVNESLTHPPEIYVWRKGSGIRQITRLSKEFTNKRLPKAREVIWLSDDGVTVHGWLLEPVGGKPDNNSWPLVTFVHGGPSFAYSDEFAFYFKSYGGIWPYPFEVYASNGMAVFIPNYRGTNSFGVEFSNPANLDGEPIDDIVSGIRYLIGQGIADPDRLAISGHSHGAWLASLVMTRAKLFRAGSFAEGSLNLSMTYSISPGWLNSEVHDVKLGDGASLYEDPLRYIDLSPDLHFRGLDTAVMFEAGAKALAVNMMGSPKAARHAGMPAEFIVYPQTGHNITLPRLQKESAERNLDWFRFWLLDKEDPDPAKAEQYERWRKMRHVQERSN